MKKFFKKHWKILSLALGAVVLRAVTGHGHEAELASMGFVGQWNPQGGGGIALQGSAPNLQPAAPAADLQPAIGGLQNPAVYGWGGAAAPVAPPPVYHDSLGRAFSSPGAANASNAKINEIRVAQGGIESGARVGVNTLENSYNDQSRNLLRTLDSSQSGINSGRSQNQLSLRRSMQSIIGSVRQGLRSGSVSLGNMNALDSGAADAMARAYGRVGGQQTNQARNQASTQDQQFDVTQHQLDQERADKVMALDRYHAVEADRIYQDTLNKLSVLQAQAGSAGLPGNLVDMGIKDRIIADANARLGAIDAMRTERLAAIHGLTPQEVQANAVQLDLAGAGANPFQVDQPTVIAPGGGQVPGGNLPLFLPGRRADNTPVAPAAAELPVAHAPDETLPPELLPALATA